jgi:hypothetical protein
VVVPPIKLVPFQSAESCFAFAREMGFKGDADVVYVRPRKDLKREIVETDMVRKDERSVNSDSG